MRFVDFTEIQISAADGKMSIRAVRRPIVAEKVTSILPAGVPSEVAGPNGEPVMKAGAYIFIGEAAPVLVDCSREDAMFRLLYTKIQVDTPKNFEKGQFIVSSVIPYVESNDEDTGENTPGSTIIS